MQHATIRFLTAFLFCLVSLPVVWAQTNKDDAASELRSELARAPFRIVFESYLENNWELCTVDPLGKDRKNLTRTPDLHELYPQVSPDGTKICFIQDVPTEKDTLRSVWLMDVNGSHRVKVADAARQPCWSPDGKTIAFVGQEFSRFRVDDFASKGLYFYDLESGQTRQHPNDTIHHLYTLSWTRDGNWILATVHGGMGFDHAILAIQVDGTIVHNLHMGGCRPCVSRDGTKVTWGRDDHTICAGDLVLTESSGTVSNVIPVAHHDILHLYHAAFSPDGKYISYSVGPGGRVAANGPGTQAQVAEMVGVRGKWNLYVKRANGQGDPIQLTDNEELSNKESDWIVVGSAGGR